MKHFLHILLPLWPFLLHLWKLILLYLAFNFSRFICIFSSHSITSSRMISSTPITEITTYTLTTHKFLSLPLFSELYIYISCWLPDILLSCLKHTSPLIVTNWTHNIHLLYPYLEPDALPSCPISVSGIIIDVVTQTKT